MKKSSAKIFSDKVTLIYEYNKNSPLFVRAAYIEIENENIDDAIFILRHGLKVYPENPVAILLLARAYALLGKMEIAAKLVKKGSNLIHSEETYNFYTKELEALEQRLATPGLPQEKIFFNEKAANEKAEDFVLPPVKENQEDTSTETEAIENRLEELAKTIASVKLPPPGDVKNMDSRSLDQLSENNLVVSETLANIYVKQGQYYEAIKVYDNLIKMKPDKANYYYEKVAEIKTKFKI